MRRRPSAGNRTARLARKGVGPNSPAGLLDHIKRSFADRNYSLPGGESLANTARRGLRALRQIAAADAFKPAAFSHGNLIASILQSVDSSFDFDEWQAMTNPDLFEVSVIDGGPIRFRRIA